MSTVSPSYLPQLQGLRGVAALGVLTTHVAFQTGTASAILTRFDFFVAVFFALSAFLLARSYRAEGYYRRRFWRIYPAYLACVVVVLCLFPVGYGAPPSTIAATLSFTQIYLPDALHGGLTHLWSLCVEVAFYLVLPLFMRMQRHWWVLGLVGVAWIITPWPYDDGYVNAQILPPAFLLWFLVGLYAAKWEGRTFRAANWKPLWWGLAILVCWVAGQPWFGPEGLTHPSSGEFARRILAGTLFAALVLYPYVFGQVGGILSTKPFQVIGEWSYSLFLWHIPVLSLVFPLLGVGPFQGHFWLVWGATAALSIAVAFVSYELVERPARQWGRKI